MHALRDAVRRLRQRHGQRRLDVRSDAEILRLEGVAGPAAMTPATGRTAEGFPENVFEPASAGAAATARGTGKAFWTEAEGLEFRLGREAACAASAAASEPLEAVETRLTLSVDLAAVKGFA